jgi:hypothetical protein
MISTFKNTVRALLLVILILPIPVLGEEMGTIRIIETVPERGTVLSKGLEVHLVVNVEYTLTGSKIGAVSLVIQDQDNNPIAQTSVVVKPGSGKVTLKKDFKVPNDATSVFVFTPLYGQDRSSSIDAPSFGYSVE